MDQGQLSGKAAVAAWAASLRHQAVQDGYLGHSHPEHAFGLASILDVLEIRFRDLPPDVAAGVEAAACEVIG